MNEQIQVQKQVITKQPDQHHNTQSSIVPKLITTQCQILQEYPDVFEGIGKFSGPLYHIHVDLGVTPKQTPCRPIPIHLKDVFQQEISKMLQAGILAPVTQATPWINSFILVESTDSQGQAKLWLCLDPTNLNKAMTREPYHFCTLEDISHMLADACILTECDCKKGYWHQMLDKGSSYLTTFNTEIGRYRFTVMPFSITVAWDVFQWKLDKCFGHIKKLTIIADDIMVIGKKWNHKDHDLAFTLLLKMARECNVKFNYQKLQYKCTEVNFYGETYTTDGCKPAQSKVHSSDAIPRIQKRGTVICWYDKLFIKILPKTNQISWTHQRVGKRKCSFQLGSRTWRIVCHVQERNN